MTLPAGRYGPAPHPTHRLIPSRFPPIGLFDTVATAADAQAVMDLAGWTNDRLVVERLRRLPEAEWVQGRANASVVMASFLHVPLQGARFNDATLGAWYAAASLATAAFEVGHHLRREAVATGLPRLSRRYRGYTARLAGEAFFDLRGAQAAWPEVYRPDSHAAGQALGETIRAAGGDGLLYDSLRHAGGTCIAALRPSQVLQVTQADHWEVTVEPGSPQVRLHRLTG
ncbi:RES family NAD+ phosphorylase [Roseomonas sp. 18066]|uniref:RES family NAD+ phosphorylase n=1 Tax=Roseomonas sp. 18066 TaxID=2681412 RepID=UPI00190FA71F|nr:RES family NAD+ phosphorylase [Roseomonas sp. 18066]